MKRHWGLLGWALLLMTGCAHTMQYADIVQEKGISKEYLAVLDTWSRSQMVYSGFETRVRVQATWRTREYREAYLKEYRVTHTPREEDWQRRIRAQQEAAAEAEEFLFYAYLPEKESNDFNKSRSLWSVFVLDRQGRRIEPLEIRRIDKITEEMLAFYPYIQPYYGYVYTVKFPPLRPGQPVAGGGAGAPVRLVFTSVIGRVELSWP